MYYDDSYKVLADLSVPSATRFAQANGLEMEVRREPKYRDTVVAMLRKPALIDECLETCEELVYADVDILFRPGARLEQVMVGELNVSTDFNGLCAGFMALRSTPKIRRLVRIWRELGLMIGAARQHDQATMKLLVANFQWVADLVYKIPFEVVSHPWIKPPGSVAHHFWSQDADLEDLAALMTGFGFYESRAPVPDAVL